MVDSRHIRIGSAHPASCPSSPPTEASKGLARLASSTACLSQAGQDLLPAPPARSAADAALTQQPNTASGTQHLSTLHALTRALARQAAREAWAAANEADKS